MLFSYLKIGQKFQLPDTYPNVIFTKTEPKVSTMPVQVINAVSLKKVDTIENGKWKKALCVDRKFSFLESIEIKPINE